MQRYTALAVIHRNRFAVARNLNKPTTSAPNSDATALVQTHHWCYELWSGAVFSKVATVRRGVRNWITRGLSSFFIAARVKDLRRERKAKRE